MDPVDTEVPVVATTGKRTRVVLADVARTGGTRRTVAELTQQSPVGEALLRGLIRAQLANALEGVVTQALLPRRNGGRVVVCEVMVSTPAIRALIREGKVHLIPSYIQSGGDAGMISFDQHLAQRYSDGLISKNTALELAHDPNEFKRLARV